MKIRKLLLFTFSFLLFPQLLSANIFNQPRRVSVLSTRHFDFIYPKEAEESVSYLSLFADETFEEAADFFSIKKLFRLPVAITFDSDSFSIEYTPSPYHRITIYQAASDGAKQYAEEALYEEFKKTLYRVCAAAKRSSFWEVTSAIVGGDALQPALLLNMPSAFFEGIVETAANGAYEKESKEAGTADIKKESTSSKRPASGRALSEKAEKAEEAESSKGAISSNGIKNTEASGQILTYSENLSPFNFQTASSITKDGFQLALIAEAKEKGYFPLWTDLQGSRDVYSTGLSQACMNAFSAYLFYRFGPEKIREYYTKAGEVNFFSLARGKFKKVFGLSLNQVWEDFYNSVPLLTEIAEEKKAYLDEKVRTKVQQTEKLSQGDNLSNWAEISPAADFEGSSNISNGDNLSDSSILLSMEGSLNTFNWLYKIKDSLYFFDFSHSEIAFLDTKAPLREIDQGRGRRNLLCEITSIKNLSLSDDQKYLVMSFLSPLHNRTLYKDTVRLYDLEKKAFTIQKYPLSKGALFDFSIETKAVAGYQKIAGKSYLKVYPLKEDISSQEIYSLPLPFGLQTEALIPLATGKLLMVLRSRAENAKNTEKGLLLVFHDCFYNKQKIYKLPLQAHLFKKEDQNTISFSWTQEGSYQSGRRGIIKLNKEASLEQVLLQKESIPGGIYDSFLSKGILYYSNHSDKEHLLKAIPEEKISYQSLNLKEIKADNIEEMGTDKNSEGQVTSKSEKLPESQKEDDILKKRYPDLFTFEKWEKAQKKAVNGSLNGYPISKYHLYKYSLKGSTIPLFPVSAIDFSEFTFAPGLGASYLTNTDPLENIEGLISFCAGYIDTNQKTFTTDNDFSLCAMVNTSILPFDIGASALWKFDKEGHYNLEGLLSAKWNTTIALPHNVLTLSFGQLWSASTTYYNWEDGTITEKTNWPSLQESYYTSKTHFKIDFSNIKQKGMSSFEKSGIRTSLSLIGINDPQKALKKQTEKIDEENQFTAAMDFGFFLPYTIPAFGLENWVICMPLEVRSLWYQENGTSSDSYVEILLAGYEFQKSIPGLNLYFQRAGLKLGYDLVLFYDTLKTEDPDIRDLEGFINAVRESAVDDFIYLNFQTDFSPIVGKFSKTTKFTGGLQFRMHLRSGKGEVKAIFNMGL
ncbi:MAG: hypothetical protein K6E78_02595 [Treponema sp.]|nr:hypothetical protein [Treponema sp.]